MGRPAGGSAVSRWRRTTAVRSTWRAGTSNSAASWHGYATTVHKAQGATVDATLLLADDQSVREAVYTGLSRGRATNWIYVLSKDAGAFEAHLPKPVPHDDLAVLRAAVGRSAAQELARHAGGRSVGV